VRLIDALMETYEATRKLKIKDGTLVCLNLCLQIMILVYVVGFQVIWEGRHLASLPVSGVFNAELRQPTVDDCDPSEASCIHDSSIFLDLPECNQSSLDFPHHKRTCENWDALAISDSNANSFTVNTRSIKYIEKRGCKSSESNGWDCTGKVLWAHHGIEKDVYPIDVERFTLRIDHTFQTFDGEVTGRNAQMPGYHKRCKDNKCAVGRLKEGKARADADQFAGEIKAKRNDDSAKSSATKTTSSAAVSDDRSAGPENDQTKDGDMTLESGRSDSSSSSLLLGSSSSNAFNVSASVRPSVQAKAGRRHQLGHLGVFVDVRGQALAEESSSMGVDRTIASRRTSRGTRKGYGVAEDSPSGDGIEGRDILPIGQLLEMADVALDGPINNGTFRDLGDVLILRIEYTNAPLNVNEPMGFKVFPWTKDLLSGVRYTYSVRGLDDTHSVTSTQGATASDERIRYQRVGLHFLVEQYGEIKVWSWSKLCMFLSSAAGLILLSGVVTQLYAVNISKGAEEYIKHMYVNVTIGDESEQSAGSGCSSTGAAPAAAQEVPEEAAELSSEQQVQQKPEQKPE